MATKYKVVDQPVEISGTTYKVGDVLTAGDFKPRPKNAPEEEKSELESLLDTGHIISV